MLERCTDSTGVVIGVFERAAEQLGPLAKAAQLEPETLAQHAAELLAENTYEQFDALVPALKDALGDWGLKLLGSYCRQRGALDGSTHLLQIAVARGDVDGYLAQFDAEDLRWRDIAASVAKHTCWRPGGRNRPSRSSMEPRKKPQVLPMGSGTTAASPCLRS